MAFFDFLSSMRKEEGTPTAERRSADSAEVPMAKSAIWRFLTKAWARVAGDERVTKTTLAAELAAENETLSRAEAARRSAGAALPGQAAMEAETSAATKIVPSARRRSEKSKEFSASAKVERGARPSAQPAKESPRARQRPAPRPRGRASQSRARATPLLRHNLPVEDIVIHAVERPAGGWRPRQDRAIILIHGAGVDHRDWTFSFLERIDPSWRVLAFDRPGFGGSSRSRAAASALPAHQARMLRKAAATLGVEQSILVGHSWGGAVAMAWGLDAPAQTLGVASIAGAVAPWSLNTAIENGRRMQTAALTALGEGGMLAAALDTLAVSFSPNALPRGYAEHMQEALDAPAAANLADVATINGALSLMSPNYHRFERPVELVYGESDAILNWREQGEKAAELLPNAKLTLAPKAGHMLHHTHAKLCLIALQRLTVLAKSGAS